MKSRKAKANSSTLLTTQLKKHGLKLDPEHSDPALGLGPMFTISALKAGTSNSNISYRLYYAGEACKYSASHRNAVAKAAAAAARKNKQSGNSILSTGHIPVGGKKGLKVKLVEAEKKGWSSGSEVGSESSSETSRSSVGGVSD